MAFLERHRHHATLLTFANCSSSLRSSRDFGGSGGASLGAGRGGVVGGGARDADDDDAGALSTLSRLSGSGDRASGSAWYIPSA